MVANGRDATSCVSRTNDRLNPLMDGAAFIARSAAKKRSDASPPGKVVIHPIAIRYFFCGDVEQTIRPVLDDIEKRLGSLPQASLPLRERIQRTGHALLAAKETEYLGSPRSGPLMERVARLREEVLAPLERKWIRSVRRRETMARVKAIRMAIFPGLIDERLAQAEKEQLWREIGDLYFVQQLHCYPEHYLDGDVPERLLEMVEHYEEDLTDKVRPHRPLRAAVCIGDALEVEPTSAHHPHGDPLMDELRLRLEGLKDTSMDLR